MRKATKRSAEQVFYSSGKRAKSTRAPRRSNRLKLKKTSPPSVPVVVAPVVIPPSRNFVNIVPAAVWCYMLNELILGPRPKTLTLKQLAEIVLVLNPFRELNQQAHAFVFGWEHFLQPLAERTVLPVSNMPLTGFMSYRDFNQGVLGYQRRFRIWYKEASFLGYDNTTMYRSELEEMLKENVPKTLLEGYQVKCNDAAWIASCMNVEPLSLGKRLNGRRQQFKKMVAYRIEAIQRHIKYAKERFEENQLKQQLEEKTADRRRRNNKGESGSLSNQNRFLKFLKAKENEVCASGEMKELEVDLQERIDDWAKFAQQDKTKLRDYFALYLRADEHFHRWVDANEAPRFVAEKKLLKDFAEWQKKYM